MDRNNSFLMGIEDVFRQNGAGEVCVPGKVVRGALAVGSEVDIIAYGHSTFVAAPKMEPPPTQPFTPPRLFPIRKRWP
jgi:translation elongation factor EF-Tu-like GTPase